MKKILLAYWGVSVVLSAGITAAPVFAADTLSVKAVHSSAEENQHVFSQIMHQHDIPGAALMVTHQGKSQEFDYGVMNKSTQVPVTRQTLFEVASLSKVVGAYITLRLADQGVIDLDTPLWHYWPSSRTADNPEAQKVTARMVLNHTTGFKNWEVLPSTPEIDTAPLTSMFEPGNRFSYSGEGFYLLQKTLEHVTGLSWNDLAKKEVFIPLDMPVSSYVTDNRFDAVNSVGHNADGQPRNKRLFTSANTAWTLVSNVHDYNNFIQQGLFRGKGLTDKTHQMMFAAASDADDKAIPSPADPYISWGLGIGIQETKAGKRVWHWGDNPGYKAFFMLNPATGDSVLLLTNSENGLSVYKAVLNHFFEQGDYPAVDWAKSQS